MGSGLGARDQARTVLLDHFDREPVLDVYAAAPGGEIASGKFVNQASSAALAANMFGPGLSSPRVFDGASFVCDGPVERVDVEAIVRFPWSGGCHPCLDALLSGPGWLTGIESKRYEPFRSKARPSFSPAFDRPVWSGLERYDRLRQAILANGRSFKHIDAGQLIKHALGLCAEAGRRSASARLVYLYAEPACWPDGRAVDAGAVTAHREEVAQFADEVDGDDVAFCAISYRALLERWADGSEGLSAHAHAMSTAFDL